MTAPTRIAPGPRLVTPTSAERLRDDIRTLYRVFDAEKKLRRLAFRNPRRFAIVVRVIDSLLEDADECR